MIFGLKAYLYIGLAVAALSLVGYVLMIQAKVGRLAAENGRLRANVAALERSAVQIKEANAVLNAYLKRAEVEQAEADAALEAIRSTPTDACLDAPLPEAILRVIR